MEKIKLGLLVNSQESLKELINKPLKAILSFKISLFLNKISDELKAFETVRQQKIKEYGEESKGQIKVKDENIEKYINELNILMDKDIELDIPVIKISDLGDISIEPKHLLSLSWIIKE